MNRAGVILFFLTLYTSKGAAIALHYRFASLRRHKLTVLISLGFVALLGFVSVLLLNISCDRTGVLYWHMSRTSTQCQNQVSLLPRARRNCPDTYPVHALANHHCFRYHLRDPHPCPPIRHNMESTDEDKDESWSHWAILGSPPVMISAFISSILS